MGKLDQCDIRPVRFLRQSRIDRIDNNVDIAVAVALDHSRSTSGVANAPRYRTGPVGIERDQQPGRLP